MTSSNHLDALAKPPPPPSELDELMSRDPMDMCNNPVENEKWIDKIIAYQRQQRARRESAPTRGGRARSVTTEGTAKLDLASLGLVKPLAAAMTDTPTKPGLLRRL